MPPVPYLVITAVGFTLALWLAVAAGRRREADLRNRLQDVTVELEQANARLEEMTTRDDLTGSRNRGYFFQQVDGECRRAGGAHEPVALVVADIDSLKTLNEVYGLAEGDSALARVAASMRAASRRLTDCVGRIGGEEFAILLPGTSAEGAMAFAERVRREIETLGIPNRHSPIRPVLTLSLGVACLPATSESDGPARLVAAAERALSRSKATGKNRVTLEECAAAPAVAAPV